MLAAVCSKSRGWNSVFPAPLLLLSLALFPLVLLGFLDIFSALGSHYCPPFLPLLLGYLLSHRAVTQTTADQLAAEPALRA